MNCKYQHKVNKNEIPVCNILGVNIAAINMDWLLDFTDKNIKDLSGDYMCVSNVHTTVTSYDPVLPMTRMRTAHAGTRLSRKSCAGTQIWQISFSVLWDTP